VSDPRPSWLRRLAFVCAILAQLTGLALGVAEGRAGLGAGTHIEAVGTNGHYAHDETTCGACHLRSMHGRVAAAPRLPVDEQIATEEPGALPAHPPVADRTTSNLSRAPPAVI
jgi:cytochrome c553